MAVIESDFKIYSNLWEGLLKDEASLTSLHSLDNFVQSLKARTDHPSLHRQLQRKRVSNEGSDDEDGVGVQRSNSRAPRTSPTGQAARKRWGPLVMSRLFGGFKVRATDATGTQTRDLEQGIPPSRLNISLQTPNWRTSGKFSTSLGSTAWQDIETLDTKKFGTGFLGYRTVPGEVDDDNPVASIDQLYIQASALDPLLQHLVIKWASLSRGMFLHRSASEVNQGVFSNAGPHTERSTAYKFETWEHAKIRFPDEKFENGVKWAGLKKPGRAFEKVMRKHRGDVSRVLDICRQSITFKTVQDVELCLKAIDQDPTVKIVRLKNRLSFEGDAKETGGYRDCLVNLRIVEENAVSLGLDTHVCEVQLILESFALLKTSDGHKRYVKFRNMKAD